MHQHRLSKLVDKNSRRVVLGPTTQGRCLNAKKKHDMAQLRGKAKPVQLRIIPASWVWTGSRWSFPPRTAA